MAGLEPCPGFPRGYRCGSLVRPGRKCNVCNDLEKKYKHDPDAARAAQHAFTGRNAWWEK